MKRIILPSFGLFFLFSCSSNGWSPDEEKRFTDQCVGAAQRKTTTEEAKKYCDCMLQKLKKTYSSYEKANLALLSDKDKMQKMAMECKP